MTSRLLSAKSRLHCFGLPGLQPPSPVGTFRGARKWQQRRNRDGRGTGRDLKTSGQPAQSNYLPPAGTFRKPLRSCCPIFVFLYRADTQPGYHTPSKQPGKPFSLLKTAQNVQFTWVGSLVTRKWVFYFSFLRCSHTFKLNWMIFSKVFLKHRHVLWKPRFSVKNPAWIFEIQMSHVFFFRNCSSVVSWCFHWKIACQRSRKCSKMPPDLETKTTGWVCWGPKWCF